MPSRHMGSGKIQTIGGTQIILETAMVFNLFFFKNCYPFELNLINCYLQVWFYVGNPKNVSDVGYKFWVGVNDWN